MRRSIILLLALVVIIITPVQVSLAGTIIYGWTGTIVPLDANIDPWDIGLNGLPFTISGTVNDQTVDTQDLVDTATFRLSRAELLINGMAPAFLGDGHVSFGDRNSGDRVTIDLDEVEFNGVGEPLVALVLLPNSTFAFTEVFESPPAFLSAVAISSASAISNDSSYRASVETGAVVTATIIPEPSSLVLALLAIVAVPVAFWRRRVR